MLKTPAAKHWVSWEPALEPLNALRYLQPEFHINLPESQRQEAYEKCWAGVHRMSHVSWLVAGCESGPHARPADLDWFRQARDDCQAAGVPFYLKQIQVGGKLVRHPYLDGRQWLEPLWTKEPTP